MAENTKQTIGKGGKRRVTGTRMTVSALVVLPLLILWVLLATDDDGNIALVRNDVVYAESGERSWRGTMGNATDSQYRDIAVTIRFLDANDQPVGEISGVADVLEPGESLHLEAKLAPQAVAVQVFSLEWQTGRKNKRTDPPLGPWAPWPFGYVQTHWP